MRHATTIAQTSVLKQREALELDRAEALASVQEDTSSGGARGEGPHQHPPHADAGDGRHHSSFQRSASVTSASVNSPASGASDPAAAVPLRAIDNSTFNDGRIVQRAFRFRADEAGIAAAVGGRDTEGSETGTEQSSSLVSVGMATSMASGNAGGRTTDRPSFGLASRLGLARAHGSGV